MPFYHLNNRRRGFSQDPRRGAVPTAYRRQNYGPGYEMGRPDSPYMYEQQQPPGFPQQQGPRRRLPENLNMMMNHAGKISEGINIMRQIGAFFNMFR